MHWQRMLVLAIIFSCTLSKAQYCENGQLIVDGGSYRGTVSVTRSGITCQKWTSTSPHSLARDFYNIHGEAAGLGEHNYCRNPDGTIDFENLDEEVVWCFTSDPSVPWDYCDPCQ
eukprot:gene8271-10169_t